MNKCILKFKKIKKQTAKDKFLKKIENVVSMMIIKGLSGCD